MSKAKVHNLLRKVLQEAVISMSNLQKDAVVTVKTWANELSLYVGNERLTGGIVLISLTNPKTDEPILIKIGNSGVISSNGKVIQNQDDFEKLINFLIEV